MILRIFVVCLSAAVIIGAGVSYVLIEIGKRQFQAPSSLDSAVFYEIPKGAGVAKVARDLVSSGIINDNSILPAEMVFLIGAQRTERAQSIRFGTFDIPARASMDQILDIITLSKAGKPRYQIKLKASSNGGRLQLVERQPGESDYNEIFSIESGEDVPSIYKEIVESSQSVNYLVSIPEGLTSWQIIESLKQAEFLVGEIEALPLEGSLAPDTYLVSFETERAELLRQMEKAQSEILAQEWEQKSDNVPVETPNDALILASLIEKETGISEERGLVASVFVNRLQAGMPLQTDPTIIYGITEGKAPLGRGLRKSELKRDTPYNTYLHRGLPPSPIANPGKQSIRAALNPVESKYLFFVADGSGGHAFAVSYKEHQKNVREWRKIEAKNN